MTTTDVLEVLDRQRELTARTGSSEDLLNLSQARAAVAELVDKVDSALALGWSDTAARELRAALARCGGES